MPKEIVVISFKINKFNHIFAVEFFAGLRREGKDNVHFLVKWRGDGLNLNMFSNWFRAFTGTDETDFVNAKEAKAKIPQVPCYHYISGIQFSSCLDAGGDRLLRGEAGLVHW